MYFKGLYAEFQGQLFDVCRLRLICSASIELWMRWLPGLTAASCVSYVKKGKTQIATSVFTAKQPRSLQHHNVDVQASLLCSTKRK